MTGDHNIQTQKVSGTKQVVIKTVTLSLSEREKVNKALEDNFGVKESDITAEDISSTISNEDASGCSDRSDRGNNFHVVLYLVPFQRCTFCYKCGLLALLHDVLVVLGILCIQNLSRRYIYCLYADDCRLFDQRDDRNL